MPAHGREGWPWALQIVVGGFGDADSFACRQGYSGRYVSQGTRHVGDVPWGRAAIAFILTLQFGLVVLILAQCAVAGWESHARLLLLDL